MDNKKKAIKKKVQVDTAHDQEAMMYEGGPINEEDLKQEKKKKKKNK